MTNLTPSGFLSIGNASLEFEEVGSGRRNSAPIDEQGAPPV